MQMPRTICCSRRHRGALLCLRGPLKHPEQHLERVPQPGEKGEPAPLLLLFRRRHLFVLLVGQDNKQSDVRFSEP